MSKNNEGSNMSFRGLSRPYSLYPSRNSNIIRNLRATEKAQVDNYLYIKSYGVGGDVNKDMDSENYTEEFNPFSLQEILFPGMADFIDENIEDGGDKSEETRLIASFWNDLGDDVFDDWGYFFLYDVVRGKYYFPILSPINLADGVVTTQTFLCFDKTFTIRHGWRARGIFMMDISCSDTNFAFRFGAYGNFGSDGDEDDYDMTARYGTGASRKTLYYHHHGEQDDSEEVLYSYFVPYNDTDNASKPYASLYNPEDTDDNSLITKSIKNGIKIYFAKENDVKNWVIADILEEDLTAMHGDIRAEGNILAEGQILSHGPNLGQQTFINFNGDADYYATSSIVNSYYISNNSTDNHTFYIPSAETMALAIPNFQEGTSFRLTINNMANVESGYSWNLSFGGGVNPDSLKTSIVGPGCIVTYIVILYYGEGPGARFLQESEIQEGGVGGSGGIRDVIVYDGVGGAGLENQTSGSVFYSLNQEPGQLTVDINGESSPAVGTEFIIFAGDNNDVLIESQKTNGRIQISGTATNTTNAHIILPLNSKCTVTKLTQTLWIAQGDGLTYLS